MEDGDGDGDGKWMYWEDRLREGGIDGFGRMAREWIDGKCWGLFPGALGWRNDLSRGESEYKGYAGRRSMGVLCRMLLERLSYL